MVYMCAAASGPPSCTALGVFEAMKAAARTVLGMARPSQRRLWGIWAPNCADSSSVSVRTILADVEKEWAARVAKKAAAVQVGARHLDDRIMMTIEQGDLGHVLVWIVSGRMRSTASVDNVELIVRQSRRPNPGGHIR